MEEEATGPKVALVCDWLIGGGAERVVHELHKMYPDAPIYTSYATHEWQEKLDGKVVTGYLQKWPFSSIRKFIPFLRAYWFSKLDLDEYDLVISASGAEAKFVKTKLETAHIAYIHAPTHYYWSRYDDYIKNPGFGAFNWLARFGLKVLVGPMRKWDYRAAQRPDKLIANSSHIQAEIKKYYRRDSAVVFPPVNLLRFKKGVNNNERKGFASIGRLAPYKRVDLAVAACTKLDVPLVVLGGGPELKRLQAMAGPTISFIPKPTDQDITDGLTKAEGFIFPGLDDFGITPVEALAAGTPVIAYKAGGALDYVIEGKNGVFFENQTVASLTKALKGLKVSYSRSKIVESSQRFSEKEFKSNMSKVIKESYEPRI